MENVVAEYFGGPRDGQTEVLPHGTTRRTVLIGPSSAAMRAHWDPSDPLPLRVGAYVAEKDGIPANVPRLAPRRFVWTGERAWTPECEL